MIVSRSRLRIKFKKDASLMMVARGKCKLDLSSGMIEMWSNTMTTRHFPFRYELMSDRIFALNRISLMRNGDEESNKKNNLVYDHLHHHYDSIFGKNVVDILSSPTDILFMYHYKKSINNRTSYTNGFTNYYDDTLKNDRISKIKIYFRGEGVKEGEEGKEYDFPEFYSLEGKLLTVREERYTYVGRSFNLFSLHDNTTKSGEEDGDEEVITYFYLSMRYNFILFIPSYL